MKCPICFVDLVVADRQGVEIDYCPTCRGVWLDRGELDKIIDRSAALMEARPAVAPQEPPPRSAMYDERRPAPGLTAGPPPPSRWNDDSDDDHRPPPRHKEEYYRDEYRPRKRGGFLSELFDFD